MTAGAGTTFGFSYSNGGDVSSPNRIETSSAKMTDPLAVSWDPVERWLRRKKSGTVKIYNLAFKQFLQFAKTRYGFSEPIGFLNWANSQSQWIMVAEAIEGYTSKLKPSVKPIAASALKTFLEKNGYKALPKMGIEAYRGEYIEGYTREQVLQLLSYLDDPLQKLFILFEKDDGFRANTNLALKWHHLKRDFDAEQKFVHPYLETEFYPGRKTAGLSFIGPDCLWLLKDLIKQGKIVVNPETCNPKRPDQCKCAPIFPFSYETIAQVIRRAKKKGGLPETIQPTHGLRKFFENALDKCEPRLDLDKKRQLEGHSLGVRKNYTDQVESLRPLYERAYPHLSLSEEVVADRKMKTLIEELRTAKSEIQRLQGMEERVERLELAQRQKYTYG